MPHLTFGEIAGPAEITQLDIKLAIQQNILWLEIAMNYPLVVEVLYCLSSLVKESESEFMWQSFLRMNVIEYT